jgi:hypothetical protein
LDFKISESDLIAQIENWTGSIERLIADKWDPRTNANQMGSSASDIIEPTIDCSSLSLFLSSQAGFVAPFHAPRIRGREEGK